MDTKDQWQQTLDKFYWLEGSYVGKRLEWLIRFVTSVSTHPRVQGFYPGFSLGRLLLSRGPESRAFLEVCQKNEQVCFTLYDGNSAIQQRQISVAEDNVNAHSLLLNFLDNLDNF